MLCSLSNFLLFGASVFSAIAAPTPSNLENEVQLEKRQTATVLRTISPNYLVPLNSSEPNHVYGSQYTGDVNWDTNGSQWSTIIGFDVPAVEGANLCYLRFVLPPIGSTFFTWVVEGSGIMNVYNLSRPVNPATDSWNNRPTRLSQIATTYAPLTTQGGEATIDGAELSCEDLFAAQRVDFEFAADSSGSSKNRVETFQLSPADNQGWYLEFSHLV